MNSSSSGDNSDISKEIDTNIIPMPEISVYSSYVKENLQDGFPYYNEFKEFNLPMAMTGRVEVYLKYFTETARSSTQKWLNRSNKYTYLVRDILIQEGVPSDLVVLAITESGYNSRAVSTAGATGMWQFMAGTGKMYGMENNFWVDERRDFEKSTRAAAKYLKYLYEQFDDWYLALAAYNAGPGRMARAIKKHDTNDFFEISSNNTLKIETRDYVPKFLAQLIIYKNYLKYGFDAPKELPMLFSSIEVPAYTNILWLADKLDISYDEIRELNPALKLPLTPPYEYTIRVPYKKDKEALKAISKASKDERMQYKIYEGKKGESIDSIASKNKIAKERLVKVNAIKTENLYTSRPLLIPLGNKPNFEMDKYIYTALSKIDPVYYKVRKGDTFIGIAKKHHMLVADLKRLNPKVKTNRIFPGQLIAIGRGGDISSKGKTVHRGRKKDIKYKVKQGDTLWSIAQKHKTTVAAIKQANKLRSNSITAGKVITIKR